MTDPQTAADAAERDAAVARVEAWLDGYNPILPKGAVRTLLEERARMAAELEHLHGERAADNERIEYATDLLIALARTSPCLQEKGGCITHDRYLPEGSDCPHGLARAFLAGAKAHRRAETAATRPADGSDAEGSAAA